jgi:hypothetical protein
MNHKELQKGNLLQKMMIVWWQRSQGACGQGSMKFEDSQCLGL